MIWLKSLGSSVYVYIALVFAALLAILKMQTSRLKTAQKDKEIAEYNANELIRAREVLKEIDKRKLSNEKAAAELKLEQSKSFGEITHELDQMDADNLIVKLGGMLNDRKNKKDRGAR